VTYVKDFTIAVDFVADWNQVVGLGGGDWGVYGARDCGVGGGRSGGGEGREEEEEEERDHGFGGGHGEVRSEVFFDDCWNWIVFSHVSCFGKRRKCLGPRGSGLYVNSQIEIEKLSKL